MSTTTIGRDVSLIEAESAQTNREGTILGV